jgi:hypothetical protein
LCNEPEAIDNDNIPAAERVTSTVTKHIKIYSDNPIHDAIDRIIDSCALIDEDNDYRFMASSELKEAAEDLLVLACSQLVEIQAKYHREYNEQIANKE